MLQRIPLRGRRRDQAELGFACLVLLGLELLILWPHIESGGFYYDDWSHASAYRFGGYRDLATDSWRDVIPGRPVLAFLIPLPHALFGLNATYHLAVAAALSGLASWAFFVFLRGLGIEGGHALGLAVLSLVFPWSDAVRLWPTASLNNVSLIAYFLGTVAALDGLSGGTPPRRRRAVLLHLTAAILYVISVLTYEVAAGAILLSGVLYRTRASWRAVRKRWLFDACLVVGLLLVSLVLTARVRHVGSPGQRLVDLERFVKDGLSIFASMFLPHGVTSTAANLLVLTGAAAVAAAALVLIRRRNAPELQMWLWRGAAGVAAVALGYVMYLGSGLFPLYSGVDDRANTFAAFGFVAATYSTTALVSLIVARGPGRLAAAILATGTALVGLASAQRLRIDIDNYDAATIWQDDELARLRAILSRPAHGSTIFTFGYPASSAPGVPIFWKPWDLTGAMRLSWDDESLHALPIYGKGVSCDRTAIRALEFARRKAAEYRDRPIFVDLRAGKTRQVRSRSDCFQARLVFRPGRLVAGRDPPQGIRSQRKTLTHDRDSKVSESFDEVSRIKPTRRTGGPRASPWALGIARGSRPVESSRACSPGSRGTIDRNPISFRSVRMVSAPCP
jgi:hypothetical protein